jgi:hypothetical protein
MILLRLSDVLSHSSLHLHLGRQRHIQTRMPGKVIQVLALVWLIRIAHQQRGEYACCVSPLAHF